MLSEETIKVLEENLYMNAKEIEGRGICATQRFAFTHAIVFGIDNWGYTGRYCYHTQEEAELAFKHWDGIGDPLGNWIKYKGEGGDRSNPNYRG